MNRRHCLELGVGAAGAWIAGLAWPSLAADRTEREAQLTPPPGGVLRSALGFQTFTVRDLLARDPVGTLSALAEIGYRELEMVGFGGSPFLEDPLYGRSPREFKRVLDDLGLRVPSTQYSSQADDLAEIADTVQQIGVEYLVLGMATELLSITPDGPLVSGLRDLGQVERLAARLNELGETIGRLGLGFAYHNHHMEFASFDGRIAFDVLVENTDPALVKLELDVGWAKVAGVDAHEYLDRYPGRYIACHLKDYDPGRPIGERSPRSPIPEMTQLVAPGDGTVDFGRTVAAMERAGVPHAFVEVDLPDDPLGAARRGYRHLRSLRD
ncbi:MAG: sugar phosphate isomerase/epimerase [Vicinamibacterales bacterium]|nr:hypothetical protein [Acidobacteriota bacterium]MDP6371364.1 sugar phosphate isomerase/epimerase [Vicinamibacterales bacterium]MDP6608649.1 sugar phosphate isomerase/epimerase [Vicinamibacterales bacterium]HAK56751.1 hypothetical protein [Acidobacteriota bacterium]